MHENELELLLEICLLNNYSNSGYDANEQIDHLNTILYLNAYFRVYLEVEADKE